MASAGTSRRRNAREARNHATNCESTTVEATTKSFLPTPSPLNFFKGHKRGDDENDENDHNIHEKKKRKRHSSSSSWQIHQNYAPLSILLMTVLVLLAVSYLQRVNSTPGLYTPPIHKFIPAPLNKRRTACVDVEQKSVIRAFEMRNWNVVILKRKSKDPKLQVLHCYQQGSASIVWTKLIPRYWNASQPWQRQNQIPFERDMSRKAQTTEMLRQHAKQRNRPLPDFIPESYVLPNDKDALLKRLTIGPKALLRGAVPDHLEGRDDPWVLKLSAIDVSGNKLRADCYRFWLIGKKKTQHFCYFLIHEFPLLPVEWHWNCHAGTWQ